MSDNTFELLESLVCTSLGAYRGYCYAKGIEPPSYLTPALVIAPTVAAMHRGKEVMHGKEPYDLAAVDTHTINNYRKNVKKGSPAGKYLTGFVFGIFKHGIFQQGVGFAIGYAAGKMQ